MASAAPTGKRKSNKITKLVAKASAYAKFKRDKDFTPKKELRYYSSVFGWDPSSITMALQQHDNGTFRGSETLYQAMRRIPRIESASKTRANFIRTLTFKIINRKNSPDEIKNYNQFIEDNFDFICPPNDLSEINARIIWFGFCFAKITWSGSGGKILPKIQPYTHYNIQYNYSTNQYMIIDDNSSIEYISPDDPDWIFFSTGGIRPWLNGIIRAMGHSYALTIHALDRWMAFNDVEAGAIKVLHTPTQKREQTEAEIGAGLTQDLTSGDTFIEPEGYELKLLTAKGRGDAYKTFQAIVEKSDADAAILILGHNLSQEVKGGSFAAANTAKSISRELFVGDLANLAPIYQLLKRTIKRNFSPWTFSDLETDIGDYAGKPEWGIDDVKDPAGSAELSIKNATALSTFMAAALSANVDITKLNIDWHEQAEKCGIVINQTKND